MLCVPSPALAEGQRVGRAGLGEEVRGWDVCECPGGLCTDFGKRSLRLHDAAFVLVVMRVLKSESLLWSVFFQVRQLLAVDGSSALPAGTEKCQNSQRCGRRSPPSQTTPVEVLSPPSPEQEGTLEAEARCTLQGCTPVAFLAHPLFESQDVESWGGNIWGRGGVTAKSPSGMLPAAAPASCKGTGCSMPTPCFPIPKGEKSNPRVTKNPKPWNMPELSIPSERDLLPQHHNTAPLTVG